MSILRPHQTLDRGINLPYRNVGELFATKAEQYPEKTFLICPGKNEEVFTYSGFRDRYLQAALYLSQLGLRKGDRFSLVAPNSSEFLLFYFGGLALGITVVPINPDLSAQETRFIIENSNSKAVLHQPVLQTKIEEALESIAAVVICRSLPAADEFEPRQRSDSDELTLPKIDLADEAVIIYTSGTSGNPKGVVLVHQNLLADAKAISEWFQFSTETRALCILPLFHNNGQVTTLLAPIYAGGFTVIVKGKVSLRSFWGLVDQYKVSFTSVMASILSILLSVPHQPKDRTLRGILCGGQVLTRSVQEAFETRFGIPIFEGYGLTETTSFSCINGFPAEHRRLGSIGRALPVNEMAILDDQGDEVAPGVEGEICIRGFNVACEYLGLPEKNLTAFANGWFHSGDYGCKDSDGFFFFHGRRDFLIIKGGENIYGAELENVLYQHPAVAECAVIGIPDKLLGEDLCAFVKRKERMHVSEQELKNFCKGKIAAYKQAKRIVMINDLDDLNEIPKGPTKKVLYRELKEYYRNHFNKTM